MENKNLIAVQELQKGIQQYVDRVLQQYPITKIETARVTEVATNHIIIDMNGVKYKISNIDGNIYKENQILKMVIPNGNYNNMFPLGEGGSGGSGGSSEDIQALKIKVENLSNQVEQIVTADYITKVYLSDNTQKKTINNVDIDTATLTNVTFDGLYSSTGTIDELTSKSITISDSTNPTNANLSVGNNTETNSLTVRQSATIGNNLTVTNKTTTKDIDITGSFNVSTLTTQSVSAVVASINQVYASTTTTNGLDAGAINAGTINTNNVSIQSDNGRILISGNTQQFKDKNGKIRIQLGEDTSGEFSFLVTDGANTTYIDATGVKEAGIADGLIKNVKLASKSNVYGGIEAEKLNVNSLITEVNTGTYAIKSTKITVDEQGQTLSAKLSSMTTSIGDNTTNIQTNATDIGIINGQISAKIWQQDETLTGVNLLMGSKDFDTNYWTIVHGSVTRGIDESPIFNTKNGIKCTPSGDIFAMAYNYDFSTLYRASENGEPYYVSVYAKSDVSDANMTIDVELGGDKIPASRVFRLTNQWQRCSFSYTIDDLSGFTTPLLTISSDKEIYLTKPMISWGDQLKDWSLSAIETNPTNLANKQADITFNLDGLSAKFSDLNTYVYDDLTRTIGEHSTTLSSHSNSITTLTTNYGEISGTLEKTTQSIVNVINDNILPTQNLLSGTETYEPIMFASETDRNIGTIESETNNNVTEYYYQLDKKNQNVKLREVYIVPSITELFFSFKCRTNESTTLPNNSYITINTINSDGSIDNSYIVDTNNISQEWQKYTEHIYASDDTVKVQIIFNDHGHNVQYKEVLVSTNSNVDWTVSASDTTRQFAQYKLDNNAFNVKISKQVETSIDMQYKGRNILKYDDISGAVSSNTSLNKDNYLSNGSVIYTKSTVTYDGVYIAPYDLLELDTDYTISFKVKIASDSSIQQTSRLEIWGNDSSGNLVVQNSTIKANNTEIGTIGQVLNYTIGQDWVDFVINFKTRDTDIVYTTYKGIILQIDRNLSTTPKYEISELKLEKGTVATPWSLPTENITNSIQNTNSTVSTLRQDLTGFETTVQQTYATNNSVSELSNTVSTLRQDLTGFETTISKTQTETYNKNLLTDSYNLSDQSFHSKGSNTIILDRENENNSKIIELKPVSGSAGWCNMKAIPITNGQTLSFSFDYKFDPNYTKVSTGYENHIAFIRLFNSNMSQISYVWLDELDRTKIDWDRYSYTYTINNVNASYISLVFCNYNVVSGSTNYNYYKNIMINEGSINRPWSAYDGTLTSTAYGQLSLKLDGLVTELNASADIIRLKGNRISIESNNFNLTENGSVVANDLTITGGKINITNVNNEKLGYIDVSGTVLGGDEEFPVDITFSASYKADSIQLDRITKNHNTQDFITHTRSSIGQYDCSFSSLDSNGRIKNSVNVNPSGILFTQQNFDPPNPYQMEGFCVVCSTNSYDKGSFPLLIDYETNSHYIRFVRQGNTIITIDTDNLQFI